MIQNLKYYSILFTNYRSRSLDIDSDSKPDRITRWNKQGEKEKKKVYTAANTQWDSTTANLNIYSKYNKSYNTSFSISRTYPWLIRTFPTPRVNLRGPHVGRQFVTVPTGERRHTFGASRNLSPTKSKYKFRKDWAPGTGNRTAHKSRKILISRNYGR